MEIPHVNLKPPRKSFKKDKEAGDIQVISRIAFDVIGMDDETLMRITSLADSGARVSVSINVADTDFLG